MKAYQISRSHWLTPGCGVKSIQIPTSIDGTPTASQGLRRPKRVSTLSLMKPITGSVKASEKRASMSIKPMAGSVSLISRW